MEESGGIATGFQSGNYRSIWRPDVLGPRNWFDPVQMQGFSDTQQITELPDFGWANWPGQHGLPSAQFRTGIQNGFPALDFGHSDTPVGGWRLESPPFTPVTSFLDSAEGLVYFAVAQTAVGAIQTLWATQTNTSPPGYMGNIELMDTGHWRFFGVGDIFSTHQLSTGTHSGSAQILSLHVGADTQFYLNGVYDSSVANSTHALEQGTFVGKETQSGSQTWRGYLFETLVFDFQLSDAQRELVEGYLCWKWGIVSTLPSWHPYKTQPPMA